MPISSVRERINSLTALLHLIKPVPDEWVTGSNSQEQQGASSAAISLRASLTPEPCDSWEVLTAVWKRALVWRGDLEQALAVCLAVCLSTEQTGDSQLFLQLIGQAGSAKTKLCDAILTAIEYCYSLEHLTGFYSGWKDSSGEDHSAIARMNRKTLITPEGDVLMSSPKFTELMSQQRRIFDGTGGATYKNLKEDRRYVGLRTPWIIAGTPALLGVNQAHLGDRFLKFYVSDASDKQCGNILEGAGFAELVDVKIKSNCSHASIMSPELRAAYCLTGGYVNYLRENSLTVLGSVLLSESQSMNLVEKCSQMARLTAHLRSWHEEDLRRQSSGVDSKEMPARLVKQYVRLAVCLAGVLQKEEVDQKVLGIVRKVCLDTCHVRSLAVVRYLFEQGRADGSFGGSFEEVLGMGEDKYKRLLKFLERIKVLERFIKPKQQLYRWRLTEKMERLYKGVMYAQG